MGNYKTDESRRRLARAMAEEAIVLLKNEEKMLPLRAGKKVALLGKAQYATIIGGSGSGRAISKFTLRIDKELERAGLILDKDLQQFYKAEAEAAAEAQAEQAASMEDFFKNLAGLVNSGAIYEIFGRYDGPSDEAVPGEDIFKIAAAGTDTAILVIGRESGGEECDRRVEDDYYLNASEKELIAKTAAYFAKIVVVYDVNGAVDTAWMNDYPQVKAAVFMGTSGEQAAGALADILNGKVSPSGKLSQTLALSYEDYPTAKTISYNKDDDEHLNVYETYGLSAEENGSIGYAKSPVAVYREGMYVGYRYFDTFDKEVMYPFGHGLSYSSFELFTESARIVESALDPAHGGKLDLKVRVTNTSSISGKEVVQMYVAAPSGELEQPEKQLKAFAKTPLLAGGQSAVITLETPLTDLASFSEADMAYVLEKGIYKVLIGNSSASVMPAAEIRVPETIIVRKVTADIGLKDCNKGKISVLKREEKDSLETYVEIDDAEIPVLTITADDVKREWPKPQLYDYRVQAQKSVLKDVLEDRVSMEAFLNQMSVKELAVLCNGYGPGLPFGGIGSEAPATICDDEGKEIGSNSHKTANPGYENPSLAKYGIYSAFYKDGPAGVGKTAWPTGMMNGCTFNVDLMYQFGCACGYEAEIQDVDSWLAPGMNIIRNPIEGRAFEYFSEDPILAGLIGTAIAKGAIENNQVTVCPKHFALNEQETYRRGKNTKNFDAVDSIADARTVREIYLKPFEMVITEAKPTTIMSSFNKVNGTFAAGNHTLCTEILRGEWGYDGVVVTDWGDMDAVVDGADAVAAGNDVVMPGGPPVIAQVLKGYEEGRVSLEDMKTAVAHLLNFVGPSKSQKEMM